MVVGLDGLNYALERLRQALDLFMHQYVVEKKYIRKEK